MCIHRVFTLVASLKMRIGCALVWCLLAFSGGGLHGAEPAGAGTPSVAHGSADFSRSGDNLTVTTVGDRTVINWDRFGVPGGSLTHFAQPGLGSATLNRVNGTLPSRIDGSLTSNGAVFLINPRGVVVGAEGVVRADGGFVASTLDLSDHDFINGATGGGTLRFMSPSDGLAGTAVNEGLIESAFGDVFLVGTRVDNSGTINAPLGTAGLAASGGGDVVVQPLGGAGARFAIVPNANSFYDGDGVTNSGVVAAATAELIANGDAYRLAVNNSGLVNARGVDARPDGSVYLTARGAGGGAAGSVVNLGTLRAVDADGSGGTVRMTGGDVRLASGSLVDVSAGAADGDGGLALIGGEFQGGKNLSPEEKLSALSSAETVAVEDGAVVRADAAGAGTGGLAVVWADETTAFDGHISARGGETGGDGGLVEVSGKRDLRFDGTVDTAAPMGETGTLLLDPADVVIADSGGTITPAALVSALGSNNVVVFTDTTGAGDGNIFVNDDVEWSTAASGNNSLTLLAYNNIIIRANVRNFTPGASNTTSNVNTGDLTLVAGWNGTGWSGAYGMSNGIPLLPAAPTTVEELQDVAWFGNTAGRATHTIGGTGYQGSIILDAVKSANVGSRNGTTSLFGHDVTLLGGEHSNLSQVAHIGYAINTFESATTTEHIASGDIGVYAKGNLLLVGGYYGTNNIGSGYAQIGHGGLVSNGSGNTAAVDYNWHFTADTANIEILAGNDVTLNASSLASTQIGHGGSVLFIYPQNSAIEGYNWDWYFSADSSKITVNSGRDIKLTTDTSLFYTKIGHGGQVYINRGDEFINTRWNLSTKSSDIEIESGGDITLDKASGRYTQIGHGGYASFSGEWYLSANSANMKILADGNIILNRNAVGVGYPQIGHGGSKEGAVRITDDAVRAGLSIIAGNIRSKDAIVGHVVNRQPLFLNHTGDMNIRTNGGITFTAASSSPTIFHSGSGEFSLLINSGSSKEFSLNQLQLDNHTGRASIVSESALTLIGSSSNSVSGNLHLIAGWDGTSGWTASTDTTSASFDPSKATVNGTSSDSTVNDLVIDTRISIAGTLDARAADNIVVSKNLTIGGFGSIRSGQDLTVASTADIVGRAGGTALLLTANGKFINQSSRNALTVSASGATWLVWTADPEGSRHGGLLNPRQFNYTIAPSVNFATMTPSFPDTVSLSSSGFLLSDAAPTFTIDVADATRTYGDVIAQDTMAWGYFLNAPTHPIMGDTTTEVLQSIYAETIPAMLVRATDSGQYSNAGGTYYTDITSGFTSNLGYTFNSAQNTKGVLTVTARPITVTAGSLSRIYGNPNPELTGGITGGLVNGDTLIGKPIMPDQFADVGEYPITRGTLSAGSNYDLTFVDGTLTVTARPITVTVDSLSRIYGDINPPLTWGITSGSLVNGDTLIGIPTMPDPFPDVGEYPITQGTLSASPNYDLTFVGGTLTITARPITVTADNQNRIYGDINPSLTWGITSGNLVKDDMLAGELETTVAQFSNVGDYAITQGTLSAGSNYDLTFVDGTLTVTARPITVTADSKNRNYGDVNPQFSWNVTSGNLVNGDSITGDLTTAAGQFSNVGYYDITQGTLSAGSNYALTVGKGRLEITTRPITVTADSLSRIYGDTNPLFTWNVTAGSLVNGDSLSGNLATTANKFSNVGHYGITQGSLSANPNYNLTVVDGTLAITARPITVTADSQSRYYGDANPLLSWDVTSGSLVDGDLLSGSLTTLPGQFSNVGNYDITQGTLSANSNYNLTFEKGVFSITARPITVTVDSSSREYGDVNSPLTWGVTSGNLVNGDLLSGNLATTAVQFSNVGDYAITQGTLSAGSNYDLTFVDGTLTVTARPITVTADSLSRFYGDANPTLTWELTAGNLVNNDSLSGALTTTAGLLSNVGDYAITQGSLSASSNYDLTFVDGTLTVTARPITVTVDSLSRIYGDANPTLTWELTAGNLVNNDSLSGALTTTAGLTSNVGDYAITQGTLSAGSNYNLTFVDGALAVTARPITVTANNQQRIYGNANPTLTWEITSGNLVNNDSFSGDLATTATQFSNVGAYTITQGTLSAGSNYGLTFVDGTLTVTARPITVTADNQQRIYGDANPALTWEITSGDLVNNDSLSGVLATTAAQFSNVGDYTITQGSLAASSNYDLTFVDSMLSITPAELTVTANSYIREYGDPDGINLANYEVDETGYKRADDVATAVVSGNVAVNAGIGQFADVGVYNNAISIGTLAVSSPNYRITFVSNTMEITPAPLRVSAYQFTREYGDANLPSLLADFNTWGWKREEDKLNNVTGSAGLTIYPWTDVGIYTNAVTQNTLAVRNYTIDFQSNSVRVTPAPLLVTADNQFKQYNNVNPPLTWSATGFKMNDDERLYQDGVLGTDAVTGSAPGEYAIYDATPFDFGRNYAVTFQAGTMTVGGSASSPGDNPDITPNLPPETIPGSDDPIDPGSGTIGDGGDEDPTGEANLPDDGYYPGSGSEILDGDDSEEDETGNGETEPEEPGPEPEVPAGMPENGYPAVQGDVNRDGVVDAQDAEDAPNGDLGYSRYLWESMGVHDPVTNTTSQSWWSLSTDEKVEYLKQHGNEMYTPSEDVKFQQLQATFENWLNQGNNRELYEKYGAEIEAWNAKKTIYEKWIATGGV